jgi:hypothetical protein
MQHARAKFAMSKRTEAKLFKTHAQGSKAGGALFHLDGGRLQPCAAECGSATSSRNSATTPRGARITCVEVVAGSLMENQNAGSWHHIECQIRRCIDQGSVGPAPAMQHGCEAFRRSLQNDQVDQTGKRICRSQSLIEVD